jgi:hypothetical protein
MKANELRIGNYVNVPNYKQCPFRIDAFEHCSEKFIKVAQEVILNGFEVHPLTWYGGDLQPIPLTEEWLLKLGAKKDKIDNTYYLSELEIILPNFFRYKTSMIRRIEHVHQLQNLYFALTGEELTIKQQEQ